MKQIEQPRRVLQIRPRDAGLTLAAVILAFAALDDITTDRAATFAFERAGLVLCGAWLLIETWRLWRGGQHVLAAVSLIMLGLGAAAQTAIAPGAAPSSLAYLAMLASLVWFLVLAAVLAGRAWRLA